MQEQLKIYNMYRKVYTMQLQVKVKLSEVKNRLWVNSVLLDCKTVRSAKQQQ